MSDIALGVTLVAIAALVIANVPGNPLRTWPQLDAWFVPAAVAALLVIGLALILRGSFLGHGQPERWSLGALVVVSVLVIVVLAIQGAVIGGLAMSIALLLGPEVLFALLDAQQQSLQSAQLLFRLGPPELVTLVVLTLAAAIALARLSRVRAAGMVLFGLLLSAVGTDVATGTLRLTMGLDELKDGVPFRPVALGLIVVADSAIGLVSPRLLLRTYARQVAGWTDPRLPTDTAIVFRVTAALGIAAACMLAFTFAYSIFDVGLLAAFAVFGVACKLLGWNRLVLMLAMAYGPEFEMATRHSLLLSNGNPAIFMRWPLSAIFLVLTCAVLVAPMLLSLRRK